MAGNLVAKHIAVETATVQAAADIEEAAHELERPWPARQQFHCRQGPRGHSRCAELIDLRLRDRLRLELGRSQNPDVERYQHRGCAERPTRAFPKGQGKPEESQRQQRKFDQNGRCQSERHQDQAIPIRAPPVLPGCVGEPQRTESGWNIRVQENAVAQNGRFQSAAGGQDLGSGLAEKLAAPILEQKDDQERKDQEQKPRVEQQAPRTNIRAVQNLRADQISVPVLPATGLLGPRRMQ